MINPDDARAHLHELIDSMPDDQIALVWMTFQSMMSVDEEDIDELGEALDEDES